MLSVLQLILVVLKCTKLFNEILAGRHPTYSYQKHFETELFYSCKLYRRNALLYKNFAGFLHLSNHFCSCVKTDHDITI